MTERIGPPEGYGTVGLLEEPKFIPQNAAVAPDERFSMPLGTRVKYMAMLSFGTFAISGIFNEYNRREKIFRAENAHRVPRSEKNWFYYGRAKSLYAMSSALSRGPIQGIKNMWGPIAFVLIEDAVDRARGKSSKDVLSTVTSTVSCAGLYSLFSRQTVAGTSRLLKISVKFGLLIGIGQDILSYCSGRRIFYIDYLNSLHRGDTPSPS